MWSATPRNICLAEEYQRLEKYRHILVDEAQSFAPSWFRVVKLSLEPDGQFVLAPTETGVHEKSQELEKRRSRRRRQNRSRENPTA